MRGYGLSNLKTIEQFLVESPCHQLSVDHCFPPPRMHEQTTADTLHPAPLWRCIKRFPKKYGLSKSQRTRFRR